MTTDEATEALRAFIDRRLATFGRYEDAMLGADWAMSHSLLSVPLNLSLLDPLDVVRSAEEAVRRGDVELAAGEGFIRQIIGRREFVWHLYWHFGADYTEMNAVNAHVPLPDWFRDLDSDAVTARCLSDALDGVRERGWVHHIPRLMILGSHALQGGYDPAELTEWFRANFADGFEWVMPVNVIGMSQHADVGGWPPSRTPPEGATSTRCPITASPATSTPGSVSATTPVRSPQDIGRSPTATGRCSRPTTAPPARCRR